MQETWVRSLGQEDPLEEGLAIQSSILAWKTPWTEKPGGLQSMLLQRAGLTEQLTHTHYRFTKEPGCVFIQNPALFTALCSMMKAGSLK